MGSEDPAGSLRPMTFDTDVLIWYLRGNDRARALLVGVPFDRRVVPAMAYFELLQGCAGAQDARTIRKFISRNFSRVLHISEQVSHRAASLLERYAPSHGLEAADALIAATALVNRQSLATGNVAHYRIIRNLDVVVFSPS
jgi:predicted nucleic acid-binding protein